MTEQNKPYIKITDPKGTVLNPVTSEIPHENSGPNRRRRKETRQWRIKNNRNWLNTTEHPPVDGQIAVICDGENVIALLHYWDKKYSIWRATPKELADTSSAEFYIKAPTWKAKP